MSEMPQYIEKCRVSWKNKIKKGLFFRKTLLSVMEKTLQDAILDASVNQKYVFLKLILFSNRWCNQCLKNMNFRSCKYTGELRIISVVTERIFFLH